VSESFLEEITTIKSMAWGWLRKAWEKVKEIGRKVWGKFVKPVIVKLGPAIGTAVGGALGGAGGAAAGGAIGGVASNLLKGDNGNSGQPVPVAIPENVKSKLPKWLTG
jgi:uncharacterized protein (DUF697 family)